MLAMILNDCFVGAREDGVGGGAGEGSGGATSKQGSSGLDSGSRPYSAIIAGPPGSGKTSCLFQAAVSHAQQGKQVLLILPDKSKVYQRLPKLCREYPRSVLARITIRYLSKRDLLTFMGYCHFDPTNFAFVGIDDFPAFLQEGEPASSARVCAYALHMQAYFNCHLVFSMPCTNLRRPEREPFMDLLLRWVCHVMLIEASYKSGPSSPSAQPLARDHLRSEATLFHCSPIDPFARESSRSPSPSPPSRNAAGDASHLTDARAADAHHRRHDHDHHGGEVAVRGRGGGGSGERGVPAEPDSKRAKSARKGMGGASAENDDDDHEGDASFLRSRLPRSQPTGSRAPSQPSSQHQQRQLQWTSWSQSVVFTFSSNRMKVLNTA